MTRFWPNGEPISVTSDESCTPCTIIWQGQQHPVQEVVQVWRVDDAWWKRHAWREYFKLTTSTGLLLVIYRDIIRERWFLQRLYD